MLLVCGQKQKEHKFAPRKTRGIKFRDLICCELSGSAVICALQANVRNVDFKY